MAISTELLKKLNNLNEKELSKFIALVEHKKKESDMKELEYAYLKDKSALREVPFRSSTPEGEMVSNLDNFQYLMQNTRLSNIETNALYRYMTLIKQGVYPDLGIDQIYMALKISEAGKGRAEKVSIVTGSRDKREGKSFFDNLFKKRKLEVESGTKQ